MKNKHLLFIIPALMVLSSCTYLQSANVVKGNEFLEDTLAHEEVFGDVNVGMPGIRKLATVDSSIPAIGIQTRSEEANKISIRFVAAVQIAGELGEATAVWTRTMHNADGTTVEGKGETDKPCATAYTSLTDESQGDGVLSISEFNELQGGTNYTHFVVYTMRNIPNTPNTASENNRLLTAYLTCNGVKTRAVVTRVDQSLRFTYDSETSSEYFLAGTIYGKAQDIKEDSYKEGNHARFTSRFLAGDTFVIVDKSDSKFRVRPYSDYLGGDTENFEESNGLIRVKNEGLFRFYLNGSDKIYSSAKNACWVNYYVRGDELNNWAAEDAYRFVSDDNQGALINVYLPVGEFKIANSDWSAQKNWGSGVEGDASGNFEEGASDSNIKCITPGYYDIFLGGDGKIYINTHVK